MLVEVKVPALSESVAEATLVSWHKKEGEHVDRDENLIDIETDKVILELPAPSSGVLTKIIKGNGETVTGGEIIATIDTEAASGEAKSAPTEAKAAPIEAGTPPADTETAPAEGATAAPETGTDSAPSSPAAEAPALMPAARTVAAQAKLAAEEINSIKG